MSEDPYRSFATVYDAWQRLYPRPFSVALAPIIRASIRRLGLPAPKLADLACGTGTFAWWWQRTHPSWTIYGTDGSPAMIAAARAASNDGAARRASGPTHAPVFLVQDLRELSLPEPVGVQTCLFDSLNHITMTRDLLRVFQGVHQTLLPKGVFLFDLVDEKAFPEVFTGSSILDSPDLYVGIETVYLEQKGTGFGEAHFSIFRTRGRGWRRVDFDIRERRWSEKEIRVLLREAGLDLVRLERLDPYSSERFVVPRSFWACRKSDRPYQKRQAPVSNT